MNMRKSSYEGLQVNIKKIKTPDIEVWKNIYAHKRYSILLEIPEFTCICPNTGLPDFANIKIEYSPDKYCIELKSFKMYTIFYRNLGIFHENVVNKMIEDLVKVCKPHWLKITGEFNARGGIKTTVTGEYKK